MIAQSNGVGQGALKAQRRNSSQTIRECLGQLDKMILTYMSDRNYAVVVNAYLDSDQLSGGNGGLDWRSRLRITPDIAARKGDSETPHLKLDVLVFDGDSS